MNKISDTGESEAADFGDETLIYRKEIYTERAVALQQWIFGRTAESKSPLNAADAQQ